MNTPILLNFAENTFVTIKIFNSADGFHVVAVVMVPDSQKNNFSNAQIFSATHNLTTGNIVDNNSQFFAAFQKSMPEGFHIIEGLLKELTDYSTLSVGNEMIPVINKPLDLRIRYADGKILGNYQNFYLNNTFTLPMPSREHIVRVAGPVGELGFLFGGSTWYYKLCELVMFYTGQNLSSFNAILDWGCGCGRIMRHFIEAGLYNVYGADIDKFNIEWLLNEFGYKKAFCVDYDPPMPFKDKFFDIIYGHSVFTHLSKNDHDTWLVELKRVLKPGGYAFLTVCTEYGTYLTRHRDFVERPQLIEQYFRDGIAVFAVQTEVGVDSGRVGYYKLVSHTTSFIKENWSKYFKILDIIPGFAEHQDLVIVQRID